MKWFVVSISAPRPVRTPRHAHAVGAPLHLRQCPWGACPPFLASRRYTSARVDSCRPALAGAPHTNPARRTAVSTAALPRPVGPTGRRFGSCSVGEQVERAAERRRAPVSRHRPALRPIRELWRAPIQFLKGGPSTPVRRQAARRKRLQSRKRCAWRTELDCARPWSPGKKSSGRHLEKPASAATSLAASLPVPGLSTRIVAGENGTGTDGYLAPASSARGL